MDLGFTEKYIADSFQRVHDERAISFEDRDLPESTRAKKWSASNAVYLAAKLTSDKPTDPNVENKSGEYNQKGAISQFLALYSLTQKVSGSWSDITLVNNDESDTVRKTLFGGGDKAGSIISSVYIGRDDEETKEGKGKIKIVKYNGYNAIRQFLDALGIENEKKAPHHNHFHIYFKPPSIQSILAKQGLLAGTLISSTATTVASVASAAPAVGSEKMDFAVCNMLEGDLVDMLGNSINVGSVYDLLVAAGQTPPKADWSAAQVVIVRQPSHGTLSPEGGTGVTYRTKQGWGEFRGKDGYLRDSGVVQLVIGARKYSIRIDVAVAVGFTPDDEDRVCPQYVWQVSAEFANDGYTNLLSDLEGKTALTEVLQRMAQSGAGFAVLQGGALGEVSSVDGVLLSVDAAGHGWYLDTTTLDNTDDFLPMADPTIWRAKPGTAADGKMDLLSVLLHEYGHVRSLGHSADGSDFMAATLQPGERRLPTSDELAWMARRVAELKAQQEAAASAQASNGNNCIGNPPTNPADPKPAYPVWGTLGTATRLSVIGSNGGADRVHAFPDTHSALPATRSSDPKFATAVKSTFTYGSFGSLRTPDRAGWMNQGDVRFTAAESGVLANEAGPKDAFR